MLTTHFSTYVVINKKVWYDEWRESVTTQSGSEESRCDICFVVDVSGSMMGENLRRAKEAINGFIEEANNASNPVTIYTVHICNSDISVLKYISESTGGHVYIANIPEEIAGVHYLDICEKIGIKYQDLLLADFSDICYRTKELKEL